jgi:serine/threonine-protein kinase
VRAHPDSPGYRAGKFLSRHRLGSIAAALALAAIVAAAGTALLQARQARRAAADTGRVNAFLIDVLNVSSPYASGSEITLSQALDEAAGMIDVHFGNRPDLAVDVRNALAQSMYSRDRLEVAEAQAKHALADAERLFGTDDRRSVTALSILANVRKGQYRDDESRALFNDALERLEKSGQSSLPLHTDLLNDLGVLYLVGEDYAHAQVYLQRALDDDRNSPERDAREEHARTLGNLAHAERGLGHLDRADALYRQAQPILQELYPEGGPHLAVILNNRAKLAHERGSLAEALELQKQAVAMHRRSFKGDHVMVLVPLTNLARMALESGQVDLASQSAEQAVSMAVRLYPDHGHPYHVNALVALAATRMAQNRNDEAAVLLLRARRMLAGLDGVPASTRKYTDELTAKFCADPERRPAATCVDGA